MTGTNSKTLASVEMESQGEPLVSTSNFETFEREDTVIEGLLSGLYRAMNLSLYNESL